ncbi:MAG: rod shape-determining protein [Cyclobacteriaceae bacterium]|nr:rod shape-determining protein [Cyclobacteriaceae bacterium]
MLPKFSRGFSIGIDLGTANTLISSGDKILVNEPSIVAVDGQSFQFLASGHEAMLMHEKTNSVSIRTIKPLRDGVIADFSAAEMMIKSFVSKVRKRENSLFFSSFTMLFCVPTGITEVEKRAIRDSGTNAGASDVLIMYEPMAAAVGSGLEVQSPEGVMIVDIGGGTTGIAIISLSGIVLEQSVRIAGNSFNQDIIDFLKKQYNLLVGERTAERVKKEIGAVIFDLENPIEEIDVVGRDLLTGIPRSIRLGYQEIASALDKSISRIEEAIIKVLENAPPELASDIHINGIHLSGGGALLRGIQTRIRGKTGLIIHRVEDPLGAVVKGTSLVLKDRKKYASLLIE